MDDGVKLADAFLTAHALAGERISGAASSDSKSDLAVVTLTAHMLNLYTTVLELALRGKIDVAYHLTRALFDCQSLTWAVVNDERLAAQFLDDKLEASGARQFAIEALREEGYESEVQELEARWNRDKGPANKFSHVNVLHMAMVMAGFGGSIKPHYGGHEDVKACRNLFAIAHDEELMFLTWLAKYRSDALGPTWHRNFEEAKLLYPPFRRRWEDVVQRGGARAPSS
jgi:hypothetical protein